MNLGFGPCYRKREHNVEERFLVYLPYFRRGLCLIATIPEKAI